MVVAGEGAGSRVPRGRQGLDRALHWKSRNAGLNQRTLGKPIGSSKVGSRQPPSKTSSRFLLPSRSTWGKAGVASPRHAGRCALCAPVSDSPARRWARGEGPSVQVPTLSSLCGSLALQTLALFAGCLPDALSKSLDVALRRGSRARSP